MTPASLLEHLATLPAEMPLVFKTDEGEIRGGYHVTEFKLADIRSIDCGARQSSWRELSLQLLDGNGGAYMSAGKFRGILSKSTNAVAGLGQTPMQVEFAHANTGMRIYQIAEPRIDSNRVVIPLSENRAKCKPAQDAGTRQLGDEKSPSGRDGTAKGECCGQATNTTVECCA